MAATRLIALHINKGKSAAKTLKERLDYSQNPDKTDGGLLISAYECDPETAWQEFDLSGKAYTQNVGREGQVRTIAYQIRQSFKPGEITPEEANRIGYETAMRFTKGRHAFTVSTHTDRPHIHNHIIFNSVDLDGTRRWRNFYFSGIALQRLSDLICAANGLSVIVREPGSKRSRSTLYMSNESKRQILRNELDRILENDLKTMDALYRELKAAGYELKEGKYPAVRKRGWKNYIRFRSLGSGYTEEDLRGILTGAQPPHKNEYDSGDRSQPIGLLVDIEKKISEGKGKGYEIWATGFNAKQQAKVLCFLQDNNIQSLEELSEQTDMVYERFLSLSAEIREKDQRLSEISSLEKAIADYVKTKPVYDEYRKAGYSKKFRENHYEEIETHKAAKAVFDKTGLKKLPKMKDLRAEFKDVVEEKKVLRSEYREVKRDMENYTRARKNVMMLLGKNDKNREQQIR